jgi:hypothetical protein
MDLNLSYCDICKSKESLIEFSCNCIFCLSCIKNKPDIIKKDHQEWAKKEIMYSFIPCWNINIFIDKLSYWLNTDKKFDEKDTEELFIYGRHCTRNKFYEWKTSDKLKTIPMDIIFGPFDTPNIKLGSMLYRLSAICGTGIFQQKCANMFNDDILTPDKESIINNLYFIN